MDAKTKVKLKFKEVYDYSEAERYEIVQEYLTSGKKKQEIWYKYTGQLKEHGSLLRWVRQFENYTKDPNGRPNFTENNIEMAKKKFSPGLGGDSFETLQLKKRILELEEQLKDAEMKAIAFSTMVDIAEKEFNIPIRKKVNTKPLKK